MGTRSKITFVEKSNDKERPFVCIYQQFDGYLDCVGYKLTSWLIHKTIVNGLGLVQANSVRYANGFGCLVAQFIHDFKTQVGNFYIHPTDSSSEDYNYKVVFDYDKWLNGETSADELLTISVDNFGCSPFFSGKPSELLDYIAIHGDD